MKNSPLRILLAPDKFKGSISADGVVSALQRGIKAVYPDALTHCISASDGGDGFLSAISTQLICEEISVETQDPLQRPMSAPYLLDRVNETAYIEMAKASGLELLKRSERSAVRTSTVGTGIQIRDAIDKGAKKVYIGLGGSATNDAGMGIAHCFGYRFLQSNGQELAPIGGNLSRVAKIEAPKASSILSEVQVFSVNDVDNPLYGESGAAYTYAKQKGADDKAIQSLDEGLRHFSALVKHRMNIDFSHSPGSGAAGGTAYGLRTFLNARSISGTQFVLQLTGAKALLKEQSFDYIITGEGKFDAQTLRGKWIKGVVELGQQFDVPVIAVCGVSDLKITDWKAMGLQQVLQIKTPAVTNEYSMRHAAKLLEETIKNYLGS